MKLASCVFTLACCAGLWAQGPSGPQPEIAGLTVDTKGAPLRKVDLMLQSIETNTIGDPLPSYSATSASDGKFEFYGVPPGRYRLLADRAGYLRTRYGAKTPWGAGTVLTVRQGVPVAGVELRMPEQAVLSGKVGYEGLPGSLNLMLLQQTYQDGRRQLSLIASAQPDSGEFLFNRLAPGRYYLMARPQVTFTAIGAPDEQTYVPTYYPGTPDQGAAEAIVLKGGQSLSIELSVLKARALHVSGTISGVPPNAARFSVSMRSTADSVYPVAASTIVGPDGAFQFDQVPPGAYALLASVPDPSGPRLVQQQINVQGDVAGIVLRPERYPVLQGSIKAEGESKTPLKPRIVLSPGPPFSSTMLQLRGDGSFTSAPLAPGRYRYSLSDLPSGAYLKSAKLGDKDALAGVDLTEPPAADARLELVFSYAGARIDGVILDERGKPAEGVACLVPDPPQPEQSWLYRTAEAGAGGQFRFQGVRPGKYRLYAWEELEPGSNLDPRIAASFQTYSVAIEAGENESKQVSIARIGVDALPAAGPGAQ